MKCPKCGYVSFDHNQTCPKCKKDISLENERLNLTSYAPDPPSLLGALIGEGGSEIGSAERDQGGIGFFEEEADFSTKRSEDSGSVVEDLSNAEDLDIDMSGPAEEESEILLENDSLEDSASEPSVMEEEPWTAQPSSEEDSELSELDLGSLELEESGPEEHESGEYTSEQIEEEESSSPESPETGGENEDLDLGILEEDEDLDLGILEEDESELGEETGKEIEGEAEGSLDLDELANMVDDIDEESEDENILDFEDIKKEET